VSRVAAVYRAMTEAENRMATALGFVRVLPATFDKRFIGQMFACARDETPQITEPQALTLRRLMHKYRRQLRDDVVALAGERPPDPWKAEPENAHDAAPTVPTAPPVPPQSALSPQLSLL
jgi:hypothetical protein